MISAVLKIALMIICIIGFFAFLIYALKRKRIIGVIIMLIAMLSSFGFLARALVEYNPQKYRVFFPNIEFYSILFFVLFILITLFVK